MNTAKSSNERHFVATAIAISLLISLPLSLVQIREAAVQSTYEVKITGFAFVPQNLTINLGNSILWNNTDPVIHTLWFVYVANGSTYLLSTPISPDTTWTHTFNDAVELQYYSFDKLWITGFIKIQTGAHDVAVTNVTSAKSVICQTCCGNITVTAENQGDFTENFNVTTYANTTAIHTKTTTLTSGNSTTIIFTWNATGWAKGNYTLKAVADIVPGETDTTDNTYTADWVIVSMLGDITGPDGWPDGKCNIKDVALVAKKFGAVYPDPRYDPNCDLTGPTKGVADHKIDIKDVALVAKHFGDIDP